MWGIFEHQRVCGHKAGINPTHVGDIPLPAALCLAA